MSQQKRSASFPAGGAGSGAGAGAGGGYSRAAKRQRQSSAPPSTFMEELAAEEAKVSEPMSWRRPAPAPLDPAKQALAFQWVEIDMYSGQPLARNPCARRSVPGSRRRPVPIVRLYGVNMAGNSVMAHVHGFTPYFYCNEPRGFTDADLGKFRSCLEQRLRSERRNQREDVKEIVLAVQRVPKMQSLLGYHFGETAHFLQIFLAMPNFVPAARRILEGGLSVPGFQTRGFQCYEANVPFVLRFMIDTSIVGCNWVECPAGTYSLRSRSQKKSSAQLEIDVVYDSMVSHAPDGEWQKIAPMRVLSFDIECAGRKGHFPDAKIDPVIQIANVVKVYGDAKPCIRNVFVTKSCSPIPGAQVLSFDREGDMMEAWSRFVRESDCDVITGYNIMNFDLPYLMNRAETLKLRNFTLMGRILGSRATMRKTTFSSSAYGKRENVETTIGGRVIFDMLQYMFRNHKLSSYSLNAVSFKFLKTQKEDVHHSIISDLYHGKDASAATRQRLAVYCLKDAELPVRLMDNLMVLVNYIEMARVTGVPLAFLLSRGQQIKVVSMLLRKCRKVRLLIPTLKKGGTPDGVAYEGATVIQPLRAFYDEPIATLDFASLYPSIMMAHNLCYSTLIAPADVARLRPEQYEKSPSGDCFVRASERRGLLPEILDELLTARKRAKKDMKAATDPFVKAVQNGRQLALKVSANSVYGFTGATVGQLPCLAISSSVTAFGRDMIQVTKAAVEKQYTVANGYPADAVVVYGDTDSVMVKFGVPTVAKAMELGLEAATAVTGLFPNPVKLEFEKVYYPYLLMNKKRYAGLYWTNPKKWDKLDAKGIETVRRDNCGLVRTMVSKVLNMILLERKIAPAIEYTKRTIAALLQNKLDISLLVITKALGKSADAEDYKAKQAHVELAARMKKRDAGSAPAVGDRVAYVIIQKEKGAPAYKKAEDPIYVLENNIPIDTRYYLDHQLAKPLMRIFGPIIENPQSLLCGDHTRTIAKPTPKNTAGIMAFAVKRLSCLRCRTPLTKGFKSLCQHCMPYEEEVFQGLIAKVQAAEYKHARLWTECQRCQGSMQRDVICSNRDCSIFYMRQKVKVDLEDANKKLARFDNMSW